MPQRVKINFICIQEQLTVYLYTMAARFVGGRTTTVFGTFPSTWLSSISLKVKPKVVEYKNAFFKA